MADDVRVFECPECRAPLPPAADGAHVTCTFCQHATTIDYSGAAMVREQASRGEAEALFARLGRPPGVTQKIALGLTNRWLWIFGAPFLLAFYSWLGGFPERGVAAAYEAVTHARMMHVVSPTAAWVLGLVWPAGLLIATLVWGLFGVRVDARRDLQAALAATPPKTDGGPAHCRHCDAPLDVPAGALGVRCPHCGADNLVQVPAEWAARAKKIDAALRVNAELARARQRASRRRVRHAVYWRVPIVLGLLALIAWPAWNRRDYATWAEYRAPADPPVWLYREVIWRKDAWPDHALHSFSACGNAPGRRALLHDAEIAVDASKMCDTAACDAVAMFPLARGETLRLAWVQPGIAGVTLALGDRAYANDDGVLWDGFGDQLPVPALADGSAGATAVEIPIAISGWYKLDLRAKPHVVLEPCIVPAR